MKNYLLMSLTLIVLFSFVACQNESTPTPTYNVTYDYNYAGAENKQLTGQTTVTKPEDPTREGYVLLYWDLDDSVFDDWGSTLTKDISLKAIWAKHVSSITDMKNERGEYILSENYVVSHTTMEIEAGRTFAIDLNGKILAWARPYEAILINGECTINDSSESGTGRLCNVLTTDTNRNAHTLLHVTESGKLTINGGTFGDLDTNKTNDNKANLGPTILNEGGKVVINNGHFTNHDGFWKNIENKNAWSYVICNNNGEITINNCDLYGQVIGGITSEGEKAHVTIKGGNFSASHKDLVYLLATQENGKITITNGTFNYNKEKGQLMGAFNSKPKWNGQSEFEKYGFTITGGTFIQNGEEKDYRTH